MGVKNDITLYYLTDDCNDKASYVAIIMHFYCILFVNSKKISNFANR